MPDSAALSQCFSPSYAVARERFLEGAAARDAQLSLFEQSDGLATDIACFGPDGAANVFIVISGTHGVEGFCGSGIQNALLRSALIEQLPDDTALVFVHALNPHGFAYLRRTNEDNVDLNRNFLNHAAGTYPDDAAYSEVHAALVPESWSGPTRIAADAALARYAAEHGAAVLQAATCRGQFSHADGLFYGGRKPVWSNTVWRSILQTHAQNAKRLAVLDIHSGLGARGACELICGARPGSREHQLARHWFGEDLVFPGSTSTAPEAKGYMGDSIAQTLPAVEGALVVAEFGTLEFAAVLQALRADNWLHARGQPDSPMGRDIKQEMRRAFTGDDEQWQRAVVDRSLELVRHTLATIELSP